MALEFFGKDRSIDALFEEVKTLRNRSETPTPIEEDLIDILDGQADLTKQLEVMTTIQETALQTQSAIIDTLEKFAALAGERSQHLLEELRYTRGIMGTFLTEGDKRNQVLERLERSCERRESMSSELAKRLGVDLKKRRDELDQVMAVQMAPVVPNGDIEQHHNDQRTLALGDRER